MTTVSVREFSYNPSAMFARVEQGEAIEVTRHGKVIAVLLPGAGAQRRYAPLVAKGLVRFAEGTAGEADRLPTYDIPADVSPLEELLAERAEDER